MPREVLSRRALVIAVFMAAMSLTVWAGADVEGTEIGGAPTAIESGSADFDQALVRTKTGAVGNGWALQRSSRGFDVGLAVLVSLVGAALRRRGHLCAQLIAVTPLLARRYSLVVRGPPSFQLP